MGLVLEIGATLREARIRKGLELADCEQATRIRSRYLRALEEERFDAIPAPVYVRSFLRTYAELLEVDADLLLDEYTFRFEPEPAVREHEVRPLPPKRPRRRMPGGQLSWVALGGVLAVVALVWVGAGSEERAAIPLPPSEPAGAPAAPAPPPAPVAPVAPTTPAPTPLAPLAPAPQPPPRGVVLALTGAGESGSYVEVRRKGPQGEPVWTGTLLPGISRRFADPTALWIRVGWTPSLIARVNGRRVTLEGGTANFLVTRAGATRLES